MIIKTQVLVRAKPLTNEQTCIVKLRVSEQTCIVTNLREINQGEFQVMYDTLEDLTCSIPTAFSFCCYDLDQFPSRCKQWFLKRLSKTEALDPDTSLFVVNKIVDYMDNFRRVEGNNDSGYIFDATLEILCFSMSGVCKVTYMPENREEVKKCSVCLENVTAGMEISAFPCYHIFHTSCIDPWLKRKKTTCPNCRYNIDDATEDWLEDLLSLNEPIRRIPST